MAIFVDLQPAPQFDESLVRYCILNFNSIKQHLKSGRKRVRSEHFQIPGPWGQLIQVTAPWYCDVTLWTVISWYNTVIGISGIRIYWDNVPLDHWPLMFFNEAWSHKELSATNTIPGVTQGTHQITQAGFSGAESSDSGDRLKVYITYYEL